MRTEPEEEVEDKSKNDLIRSALESAEQIFPTFDLNINSKGMLDPSSQQTEQTLRRCAGLKSQMLEKEVQQKGKNKQINKYP